MKLFFVRGFAKIKTKKLKGTFFIYIMDYTIDLIHSSYPVYARHLLGLLYVNAPLLADPYHDSRLHWALPYVLCCWLLKPLPLTSIYNSCQSVLPSIVYICSLLVLFSIIYVMEILKNSGMSQMCFKIPPF